MKHAISFTIVILFFSGITKAQELANAVPSTPNGQFAEFMQPSPNAASLGVYGQVPIGHYTGLPNVSVPLYTLKYKELSVPMALSYHAAGNKPENFPGPVGLGWSLQAGGSITRVVNGLPDYEAYEQASGTTFVPYNYSPTGFDSWAGDSAINSNLKNGYYTYDDKSNPDEYYFNFNGMSGKFYLHHSGVFQIKSNQGIYLSIETEVKSSNAIQMPLLPQIPNTSPQTTSTNGVLYKEKMLYRVTITDPQGIKYNFGGTYDAIEFSRPGHASDPVFTVIQRRVVPTTWNLTSIVSPNNYRIRFDYKRGFVVTKVWYNELQQFAWANAAGQTANPASQHQQYMFSNSTLMNVSYLSKIISPLDSITVLTTPASDQRKYPHDPYVDSIAYNYAPLSGVPGPTYPNLFVLYGDILMAQTQDIVPEKFSQIIVADNKGKVFRNINFLYTNSDTTRLKLKMVSISGGKVTEGSQIYQFDYNPLSLPVYGSLKTDHYGFYNNRTPYLPMRYNINGDSLFASKEVDTAFTQAEILKKITYPTGGFTLFDYEPNTYRSHVTTWPFTVVADTGNKITGGVRIKRITSYTAPGSIASVKSYFYSKNYNSGGSQSSGVLAYQPTYYETYTGLPVTPPLRYALSPQYYVGTLRLYHWSTNPIFPMGETRGNHITYSEVTEINADSSFTTYKFKNYDNGYNDKPSVNQKSDNIPIKEFWKEDEGISMDLERGQSLMEENYNASKTLKTKVTYEYNQDTARFNNNVRTLIYTQNNLPFNSYRIVANVLYTYYPYLKKMKKVNYEGSDSITTEESFEYNENYRLIKKKYTTSSDSHLLETIYKYPFDMQTTPDSLTYKGLVGKGIINPVIEEERRSDSVLLGKSITKYLTNKSQDTTLIMQDAAFTQYRDREPEKRYQFILYNKSGGMLSGKEQDGATTCLVWSYTGSYPIARIVNASYEVVRNILGGQAKIDSVSSIIPSDSLVNAFLDTLRKAPALTGAQIFTYTFDPLAGMTRETDVNNRSTYFDYDSWGRLIHIRDNERKIATKICYNYNGQQVDCNPGAYNVYNWDVFSTRSGVCQVYDSTQLVQLYTVYSPIDDDAASPVGINSMLYLNKEATIPLPTGYYRFSGSASTGPFATNDFYYVINGRLIYGQNCLVQGPFLLTFADTITTKTTLCGGTFPVVAAYSSTYSSLSVGQYLYKSFSFAPNNYLPKGTYKYNDTAYFMVDSGKITSKFSCNPPAPAYKTITFKYDNNLSGTCPTGLFFGTTYYYAGSVTTFGIGVTMYTNATLTTPVPAGFYNTLTKRWSVNGLGTVISSVNCP